MKNGFHVFSRMFTKFARVNMFSFILFALLASSSAWAAGGSLPGSGTESDPFLIEDFYDWNAFANSVNSGNSYAGQFVKLKDNIDFDFYSSNQSLSQVGSCYGDCNESFEINFSSPFSGTFDGGKFTIFVSITSVSDAALFGYISGATIKNLVVTGTVTGQGSYAAGLVGFASGTGNRIENCVVNVNVSGNYGTVGGFVAKVEGVKNTMVQYSKSDIVIDNVIFNGTLEGTDPSIKKGAFVGWVSNYGSASISNSLYVMQEGQNTDNLDLVHKQSTSIINNTNVTVNVTDCYKTVNVGSYGTMAYLDVPANAFCIQKEIGFSAIWVRPSRYTFYVIFKEATGDGSETNPYLIKNASDWEALTTAVNSGFSFRDRFVKLEADISVTKRVGYYNTYSDYRDFNGSFDGGGHTITANITDTEQQGTALFGYISSGSTIKNLTVAGKITGGTYAAGLVGYVDGYNTTTKIENCVVSATISGSSSIGGFIGYGISVARGNIFVDNCVFKGRLNGASVSKGVFVGGGEGYHCDITPISNSLYILQNGQNTENLDLSKIQCYSHGHIEVNNLYKTADVGTYGTLISLTAPASPITFEKIAADGTIFYVDAGISVNRIKQYYLYTGDDVDVDYDVVDLNGQKLVKGTSYTETIEPSPVKGKGDYTLKITAIDGGGYAGSKTLGFTVGEGLPFTGESSELTSGSYSVSSDITLNERLVIKGDVKLFVNTGVTLNALKGIELAEGNSLTIGGKGTLNAIGEKAKAGIGAVKVGSLVIESGVVNATGGIYGAGIGGSEGNTVGGSITIIGGVVTAKGGSRAADIGGGFAGVCGDIDIVGGQVTANSSAETGIGAGQYALKSGTLTLGWTNKDDFVYASSYSVENIAFAEGKLFNVMNGNVKEPATSANIGGKKVFPRILYKITREKGWECPDVSHITSCGIPTGADEGDVVTLSAVTAEGYVFDTVKVYDETAGKYLTVADGKWYDSTASFVMPASDVRVEIVTKSPGSDLYVNMPASGTKTVNIPSGVTGFYVYDDGGKNGKYSDNASGTLQLVAPKGLSFSINVKSLSTESGNDKLTIYDGINSTNKLLDGMSGNKVDYMAYSTGNSVKLYFESNGNTNNSGFEIQIYVENRALTGMGTEADPFIIGSDRDWDTFRNTVERGNSFVGKFIRLDADITASGKVGNVDKGLVFSGTFDGKGKDGNMHTITANISDTDHSGTALFHNINGATIKNLTVAGRIVGGIHTAGLVGYSNGTGNKIENCVVSATVEGSSHIGGILGHGLNSDITIDGCVFKGKLVGGTLAIGVLFGWGDNGGTKVVKNSLYVAKSDQTFTNLDLVKMHAGSVTVTDCYKTTNVGTYGKLVYLEKPENVVVAEKIATDGTKFYMIVLPPGSGTEDDPYIISNEKDWNSFAYYVYAENSVGESNTFAGKFVKLAKDISVTKGIGYIDLNNMQNGHPFSGTFDGGGHTVTVSISGNALFNVIEGATIKNLTVAGRIVGGIHTAGVVGYSYGKGNKIENCVVSATVEGNSYIGGILGHGLNSDITIDGCVFKGKLVGGTMAIGVLFGWGDNGGTKVVKNSLYIAESDQTFTNLDLVKMNAGSVTVTDCYKTANEGTYGTLIYLEKPEDAVAAEKIAIDGTKFYIVSDYFVASSLATDDDGYYVNMPTTGAQKVVIPPEVTSFKLYDDGGKDGAYSKNASGTLQLVAPEGYAFWVAGNGYIKKARLIINDGETDVTQITDNYNGRGFSIDAGTSGNIMTVLFTSNETEYYGFALTVWVVKKNEEHRVTCSADDVGGTLTCDKTRAKYGDTVSFAVTRQNRFYFNGVKVSGENYEKVLDWYSDSFVMPRIDVTVTPVFTEEVEAYVKMPVTGTKNITIPPAVTAFKVYDADSYNCDGLLSLTAPEGYALLLAESEVYLSRGSEDYLEIFDGGVDGKIIYKNIGGSAWGQDLISGNVMTMTFKSENKSGITYSSAADFVFTVYVVKNDFSITCKEKLEGGTLSCSKKNAPYGESVDLTIKPGKGYGAYGVVISGVSFFGKKEEKTIFFDGLYFEEKTLSFDMPLFDVTVTPVIVKKLPGDGTAENPYVISSASDWGTFVSSVNDGFDYKDKFVKLSDNIEVSKKAGDYTQGRPFSGTFDGDGHTITANITDVENPGTSLFGYISSATIKNLIVTGNITGGLYAAGFAGYGDNSKIENCVVSATITGNTSIGGILGVANSTSSDTPTIIDNCVFKGKLVGDETDMGVFAGSNASIFYNANVISNSLYILQENQNTENLDLVIESNEFIVRDCYKTADVGMCGSLAYLSKPANMTSIEMTAVDSTKFYVPFPMDNDGFYVNMPLYGMKKIAIPSGLTNFRVFDDGGKDGKRSSNADGTLQLVAPDGYVIQVTGDAESKGRDVLTIYDGGVDGKELLKKKGSINGIKLFSAGNSVVIKYDTHDYCYSDDNCFGLDLAVTLLRNTEYSVTCVNQVEGGTLSCGKTQAKTGDVVAVNATPAEGRYFYGVKLTGENYEKFIDDVWLLGLFTMPPFDVTVTPVFTEKVEAYVNMPQFGTKNITIPPGVTSFKVYDDGGKDGIYSQDCDGYISMTAPEGYELQVKGYLTGSGRLSVFDGNAETEPLLKDKGGYCKEIYWGETDYVYDWECRYQTNIGTHLSSRNKMTLRFDVTQLYRDTRDYESGLDLTVNVVKKTDYTVTCADNVEGGSITCGQTQAEYQDKIEFTATPNEGYYFYGFKVVGENDEKRFFNDLDEICMKNECFAVQNPVSFEMPFRENVTVTPVFAPIEFFINMPTTGTKNITVPPGVTSFKVYDDGGKDGNYSNNCDGYLVLTAPEGYVFRLEGKFVGIRYNDNDYLNVYDGNSSAAKPLVEKYLGYDLTSHKDINLPRTYSTGRNMTLYFHSDEEYYSLPEGFDLTVNVAQLYTITYAEDVNGNMAVAEAGDKVDFAVNVPEGNYLIETIVKDENGNSIEVDGGTWYDYAKLYEGDLVVRNYVGSFTMPSSNVTVTPVFTDKPTAEGGLYVNMPMNGSITARIPQDVISFKVYDEGGEEGTYSNGSKGTLYLKSEMAGDAFELSGMVNLGSGEDYFIAYDGTNDDSPLTDKIMGSATVPTVRSSNDYMKLYFESDDDGNGDGLDLTVKKIPVKRSIIYAEGISGDKDEAAWDEVVTMKVTPPEGQVLDSITVVRHLDKGEIYEFSRFDMEKYMTGGTWYSDNMATLSILGARYNHYYTVTPVFKLPTAEAGLYVEMPKNTGTKNVNIPPEMQSFKVYEYQHDAEKSWHDVCVNDHNNCERYLVLTAPEGRVLQMEGSAKTYGTRSQDYVYIYDGEVSAENTLHVHRYNESDVPLIYSSGRTLIFYSNAGYDFETLDLTVTVIDAEQNRSVRCIEQIDGGSIACDKTLAKNGDVVTVEATPDEGRVFAGVLITGEDYEKTVLTTMTSTVSFTMPAVDVTVVPLFSEVYYVNMPQFGSKNITIPPDVKTFKVYDDGGRFGDCSRISDGYLTLTAPEGYLIQLSGEINLSWNSSLPTSSYFTVFDGVTADKKLIEKLIGGPLQIPVVYTDGETLTLNSKSNANYAHSGLDLTVNVIKKEYSITCADNVNGGTIQCPKKSHAGEYITLNAIPANGYVFQGIEIKDENQNTVEMSALVGNMTMFFMPISDVTVTPVFARTAVAATGLDFINMPCRDTKTVELPSDLTSLKVYDDGGKDGNYSTNCDGFLTLSAPEGYSLQMEGSMDCTGYLYVYDGNSPISYKLVDGKWNQNKQVASSGSDLTMYLWTHSAFDNETTNYNRPGLDFTVTVVKNDESHPVVCNNADVGGTASCDKASAKAGEMVTLTATPEQGYLYYGYQISGTNSIDAIGDFERTELADGWYPDEKSVTFGMVSSDVTVTPLFTDKHSAEDGLTVMLPTTGTKNVNIPEVVTSFKVVDDTDIDFYRKGSLVLTAPVGYVLELSGSMSGSSNYDYLSAYDGADMRKSLFDRVFTDGKTDGKTTLSLPTVRSTGRNMTLFYFMQWNYRTSWIDLTVRVVKAEKPSIITITEADGKKTATIDGAYDGTDALQIDENITVENVVFNREFHANTYSTMVLPFAVNTAKLEGLNAVLYYNGIGTDKDGNDAVRMKVLWATREWSEANDIPNADGKCCKVYGDSNLTANTPYLVQMGATTLKVNGPVTIVPTTEAAKELDGWKFRGMWEFKRWDTGDRELGYAYGFAASAPENSKIKVGDFVKIGEGTYIYPLRAYLVSSNIPESTPPVQGVRANGAYAKRPTVVPEKLPELMSVIVDDEGDGKQTTVIGHFNTRTGEFKMNNAATKRTFDVKGRRVNGEKSNARGAYYGKKVLK
jgi:hypothetical protein